MSAFQVLGPGMGWRSLNPPLEGSQSPSSLASDLPRNAGRHDPTDAAGSRCSARPFAQQTTIGAISLVIFGALSQSLACHPRSPTSHPASRDAAKNDAARSNQLVASAVPTPPEAATTPPATLLNEPERESRAQPVARERATKAASIADASWSDLPVDGFQPALLWYRATAPVLVVTHGAGGFAEWHCQHFHQIFAGKVTLLCPRGKPIFTRDTAQGFYYPDHLALRREVHAVIARYEAVVSDSGRPYAYAGYSQGATMGALALSGDGAMFSRLLLVEGGYGDWYDSLIARFKKSGGQAVVVICGTKQCHERAHAAIPRFARAGLAFKTATARGAGHRPDGAVEKVTLEHLGFLFDGDARWAEAISDLQR